MAAGLESSFADALLTLRLMHRRERRRGEKVSPLGPRIVSVADAFDAMTSDRPYRKGIPPWQALQEIVNNSGKQFDAAVVEAFKRVIQRKLEGI